MKKILLSAILFLSQELIAQPGTIDYTLNTGQGIGGGDVRSIALQQDKKILLGGSIIKYNNKDVGQLFRINANGMLDTTFNIGSGINGFLKNLAIQQDGKILAVGEFNTYNGINCGNIVRLNSDGSIDTTFNPGTGFNSEVNKVIFQPDGKILAGGKFTNFNGTAQNYVVRLNANGSLDTTFKIGSSGFNNEVISMAIQQDGKVLVGGTFTNFKGTAQNRIARLLTDGSLDTTFKTGTGFGSGSNINAIVLRPDGKLMVGGWFTGFNSITRNHIARLNTDGSLDTTFKPGTGFSTRIWSLALQPDGKVIAGGEFTSFNGTFINRLARLNENGSIDSDFQIANGFNNVVFSIELQEDRKILVGGRFNNHRGVGINGIVRLNGDCEAIAITAQPGASAVCKGDTATFSVTATGTEPLYYLWKRGTTAVGYLSAVTLNNITDADTGSYTITVSDLCNQSLNTAGMSLTLKPQSTADAGADQTLCANTDSVSISGFITNAAVGTWSTSGTGTFGNDTDLSTAYTPSDADKAADSVMIFLTASGSGVCTSVSDTVVIKFDEVPAVDADIDQTVCANSGSVLLNGSTTVPTGALWSSSGTGTFAPDSSNLQATYNASASDIQAGNVKLYLTTAPYGACASVLDSINVDFLKVDSSITLFNNTFTATQTGASYIWKDCLTGDTLSTAKNYTPSASVTLKAVITLNGCVDSSSCTSILITGTGSKLVQQNIKVYPNPTSGIFHLDNLPANCTLRVIDQLGRLVLSKAQSTVLDLSREAKGMYVLEVISDNDAQYLRIEKE